MNHPSYSYSIACPQAQPSARDLETEAYAMIPCAPAVPAEEVELMQVAALEIVVSWGRSVLHVAHRAPGDFYVGDAPGEHCDFSMPSDRLGARRIPLVLREEAGLALVIPEAATGTFQRPLEVPQALDRLRQAATQKEHSGAHRVPLVHGARARLELSGFVFEIALVHAGRPPKRGLSAYDWSSVPYFGLSLAVHTGLLGLLAFLTPRLGLADDETLDRDRMYVMQQLLDSAAEREREQNPGGAQGEPNAQSEGGTGASAAGAEGALGKPLAQTRNTRMAMKGPRDNPDPQLSRAAAQLEATSFGLIALLTGTNANTPLAPWGRDAALGADPLSVEGRMWGDEIGEAFGVGGLGFLGLDEGGGRRGVSIGLGDRGIGSGLGLGTGPGMGSSAGLLRGTHATRGPSVRIGASQVSGRLPPEVIQRVVRQNFGRFRLCYTQGLTRNPNLEGRVAARFVIGRDGAVSHVVNGGSDLPDSGVTSCVLSAFYGLSFPEPEHGIVTVVYPILLAPG